jgi:hypothetical protein
LQYSFNTPRLQNSVSLCITPVALPCADAGWVTTTPGQADGITSALAASVLLDSARIGLGMHEMTVTLVNNSATPLIHIPVRLTVTGGRMYRLPLVFRP